MRIMALDVGTKRIGVAISDEMMLIAQGVETIRRRGIKDDLDAINNLIRDRDCSEVVVGLPLNMNGSYSQQTKEVVEFMDRLSKAISVPAKTWDERLTTVQAERALLEADVSRAKRKRVMDKLAAQLILQSYLDSRKRG